MRLTIFLACFVASVAAASHADAKQWPLGSAWPAPVGHFQPRARDIPFGSSVSPSLSEQDAFNREIDEKLKICRGC